MYHYDITGDCYFMGMMVDGIIRTEVWILPDYTYIYLYNYCWAWMKRTSKMNHEIKIGSLLFVFLIVFFIAPQSFAASKITIFYLGENYHPVVKLQRLSPVSDGMRAILAMYALQNGAGCDGSNQSFGCLLPESLNLGKQCSEEHIDIIRTWFKKSIPKMSGYSDRIYKDIQTPGDLEAVCYKMPDTATFQNIWDLIRVTQNGNNVIVDAHGVWSAREETGSFRYITEYRINKDSVVVVSHKKIPVGKKK